MLHDTHDTVSVLRQLGRLVLICLGQDPAHAAVDAAFGVLSARARPLLGELGQVRVDRHEVLVDPLGDVADGLVLQWLENTVLSVEVFKKRGDVLCRVLRLRVDHQHAGEVFPRIQILLTVDQLCRNVLAARVVPPQQVDFLLYFEESICHIVVLRSSSWCFGLLEAHVRDSGLQLNEIPFHGFVVVLVVDNRSLVVVIHVLL